MPKFKVELPKLDGVSAEDLKEYIEDAVGGWKGGFHPGNPLFELKRDDVSVTRFRTTKDAIGDVSDTLSVALGLLREADELLIQYEENGMNHPVCWTRQRIQALRDGDLDLARS